LEDGIIREMITRETIPIKIKGKFNSKFVTIREFNQLKEILRSY